MFRFSARSLTIFAVAIVAFFLGMVVSPTSSSAARSTSVSGGEEAVVVPPKADPDDEEPSGFFAYITDPDLIFEKSELSDKVSDWLETTVRTLRTNGRPVFDAIGWPIEKVLDGVEAFLLWLPWPIVMFAFAIIPWFKSGKEGWKIGAICIVGFTTLGFLGYWDLSMTTLSMILTALGFSILVGVPIGIIAAKSDRMDAIIRPVLDAMQTIHPFVYLVPIVMFFGIGKVPGTMATIIFALPPMIRLTNLGIRQVPSDVVEAGRAFGTNSFQLLWDAQLPLALPTIMAGLNQTLMLALSMVVIVALINGGGLGKEIYGAVQTVQIGRAVTSGAAVLVLAIVLDRVSQVKGKSGASAH